MTAPLLALAANAADLGLAWLVLSTHPAAEANPAMAGALSLGLLGGVAWKAALLAVVMAAAELGHRRWLLWAVTAAGAIGAASALVALGP
jgi:Domain of unknown function (DUF5658)